MIDMEKVIKELSELHGSKETMEIIEQAIALLKVQEAKPMTEYDDGWDCPRCGLKLVGKTASGYPCNEFDLPNDEIVKYCPECGQAVTLAWKS